MNKLLVAVFIAFVLMGAAYAAPAEADVDPREFGCNLCQSMVGVARSASRYSKFAAYKAMERICAIVPAQYKADCNAMVENLGESLAQSNDTTASTICEKIGLCAAAPSAEQEPSDVFALMANIAAEMDPSCFHVSQVPGNPKFCAIVQEKPAGTIHGKLYQKNTFGKIVLMHADTAKNAVCANSEPTKACQPTTIPKVDACVTVYNNNGVIHGSVAVSVFGYSYKFLESANTGIRC